MCLFERERERERERTERLLPPEVENSSAPWKEEIGGNYGSKMDASLSLDVEKKDMSSSMSRRREREANFESKSKPLLPPDVKGTVEENIESKMKPLLPLEVEKNYMSSNTWKTNLQEFPALPERRDGEHSSFTLRHPLRTPSKPNSQILCTYNIIDREVFISVCFATRRERHGGGRL